MDFKNVCTKLNLSVNYFFHDFLNYPHMVMEPGQPNQLHGDIQEVKLSLKKGEHQKLSVKKKPIFPVLDQGLQPQNLQWPLPIRQA